MITEVTRMSGGLVCVAGIDLDTHRIVRPLQEDGSNWDEAQWVAGGYMHVGAILDLEPAAQGNPAFPHASEDWRVATVAIVATASPEDLYDACVETADGSLDAIFGNMIVDGRYIIADTRCRSLGCVIIDADALRTSGQFNKVQLSYRSDDGDWVNLPVTELQTKAYADSEAGAAALAARIAAVDGPVTLRIGLGRAWDGGDQNFDPKRCYIQLNGIVLPA